MQQSLFSAGLILAWLVTPESLRFVDVTSGMSGLLIIVSLGCGLALSLVSGFLIHNPTLVGSGYNSDYKALSNVCGKVTGLTAVLSGRIPLLLFVSTGMLVTAGYAFNEIFLYWFPNFLFAFILLILVTILNISGKRYVYFGQSAFVMLTITGLLVLIMLGVGGESAANASFAGQQKGLSLTLLAMGCLSFLGFDFLVSKQGRGIVVFSLLGGFVLLLMWGTTALKYTAPELLEHSTIAHMIVARAIAGDLGRFIMGGVVIFGVLSGVNGLFIVVRRIFMDLSEEGMMPKNAWQNWVVTAILAATIGVMMITGFAGEQILDVRIKASIILWLYYLSLRMFSVACLIRSEEIIWKRFGYLTSGLYLLAGVILTLTSTQVEYVFGFTLVVFLGAMVLSLIWTVIHNSRASQNPISRRM